MSEPANELGGVASFTGFFLIAHGLVALTSALQIGAGFQFASALARDVLPTEMVLGAALVLLGAGRMTAKAWARVPALLVTIVLLLGGGAWFLWFLFQGGWTPLGMLVPAMAVPSLILQALTWREVGRVGAALAAADREARRMVAEAAAAGDDGVFSLHQPPRRGGWVFPVLAAVVVGVPGVVFATAVAAPAKLEAVQLGLSALRYGVNPFEGPPRPARQAYRYDGSPLEWYATYEARFVELDVPEIMAFGDDLARAVGLRLVSATGEADPVRAEVALWEAMRGRELPLWIAEELRNRGAFYAQESLLSRSFDPNSHLVDGVVHFDCDQLVYLFLHVAWRLDLDMAAVPSPFHAYLEYTPPGETGGPPVYVETTAFRKVDVRGARVDYLGEGIGEDFFVDEDFYISGKSGTWATRAFAEAAGLYDPADERRIRDSIVGNVLVGLERSRPQGGAGGGPVVDAVAEAEAHVEGSRDATLVGNLYAAYVERGTAALEAGRLDEARSYAQKAIGLRASHGILVGHGRTWELELLAKVDAAALTGK